jgi:hypothetical protein
MPRNRSRKHTAHSIEERLKLLSEWEISGLGAREIARLKNIPHSTILTWKKKGKSYYEDYNVDFNQRSRVYVQNQIQNIFPYDDVLADYIDDRYKSCYPVHRMDIIKYGQWRFPHLRDIAYFGSYSWSSRIISRLQNSNKIPVCGNPSKAKKTFSHRVRSFSSQFSTVNAWYLYSLTVEFDSENSDRFCVLVLLTISGSGEKGLPVIVLGGRPGGKLEMREIPKLPSEALYIVQEQGIIDESVALFYLKNCLAPLTQVRNQKKQILFMHPFSLPVTEAVRLRISEMNVEWFYVPGYHSCPIFDKISTKMQVRPSYPVVFFINDGGETGKFKDATLNSVESPSQKHQNYQDTSILLEMIEGLCNNHLELSSRRIVVVKRIINCWKCVDSDDIQNTFKVLKVQFTNHLANVGRRSRESVPKEPLSLTKGKPK